MTANCSGVSVRVLIICPNLHTMSNPGDASRPEQVTVGSGSAAVDPSKFNAPDRYNALFLTGSQWEPLTERRLPGADGVPATTVIHPGQLVCRLFRRVLLPLDEEGEPRACWETHFGEQWKHWDAEQLREAHYNANDLVTEYEQYRGAGRSRVPLHT